MVTVNSQASSGMRGVGPAESTGKSLVRYWPGGSCLLLSRLRPPKPLVMMPIGALLRRSALVLPNVALLQGLWPEGSFPQAWRSLRINYLVSASSADEAQFE